MSKVTVELVNSFTKNGEGGNAAGVVLNADGLTDEQKLTIAQEVGFSETAFVSNDSEVDFNLSFFTTTDEVDFCGHATVAAFSTMFQKGMLAAGTYIQRTKAGVLEVAIEPTGEVIMEQQLPQTFGCFSSQDVASLLGIKQAAITSTELPIEIISTGLPDVIIPVASGYLDTIIPDDERIAAFSKEHQVVGFHVFELCELGNGVTASCRNFAPLYGISEECATGTSNGALACYLATHTNRENNYVFEQGRAMKRASLITASVQIKDEKIIDVRVGGFAKAFDTVVLAI